MREVICGDCVRFIVGEISRAQQMDLWRDSPMLDTDNAETNLLRAEAFGEMVAIASIRAVERKVRTEWARVNKPETVKLNDYESVVIDAPMTVDLLRGLPKSWANQIIEASNGENGGFGEIYFFVSTGLRLMTTSAVSPSDSTASAAPAKTEVSAPTKTTGK